MDPVSAFALACNVLQIVELATKAASACKEIYETGTLSENDEIENYTTTLSSASSNLTSQLAHTARISPRDLRIKKLAEEARATAEEVASTVRQLKLVKKQNAGRILAQAVRSLAKRRPVEKLLEKLARQDKTLNSVILKELYIKCGQNDVQQNMALEKLSARQKEIYVSIQKTLRHNHNAVIMQTQNTERHIIQEIRDLGVSSRKSAAAKNMLQSLHFPEILARQDMIQQRVGSYGDTFRWIFNGEGSSENAQGLQYHPEFAKWLRTPKASLFWISGKPGSGKSSLMNYIYEGLKKHNVDQLPAPENRTVLCHFFFRPSTAHLQQSFEGLLRTICVQFLSYDPTLVDRIPSVHNSARSGRGNLSAALFAADSITSWTVRDLTTLCLDLLAASASQDFTFLLIDGIDEVREDEQEKVTQFILDLDRMLPSLKICCSSRPEALFKDLLGCCQSIRLQDLNHNDMQRFCDRELHETKAAGLRQYLVAKAEGVFLWVYLVVNDLKRASRYENEDELRERLQSCPADMSALFSHMLSRIDRHLLQKPRPFLTYIYQFHKTVKGVHHLTTLELILATHFGVQLRETSFGESSGPLIDGIAERCALGDEQITAHCAGLVEHLESDIQLFDLSEATSRSRIDEELSERKPRDTIILASGRKWRFIHRTVLDFLEDSQHLKMNNVTSARMSTETFRQLFQSQVASLKLVHCLLPNHFALKEDINGWRSSLQQAHDFTNTSLSIAVSMSKSDNDIDLAYEVLDELITTILHCWGSYFTVTPRLEIKLDAFGLRSSLVGNKCSLRTQLCCLATQSPLLVQYVTDRINNASPDEQLDLAALAFLNRLSWISCDDASPYINFDGSTTDALLYLEKYDILNHEVKISQALSRLRGSVYHKTTVWHHIVSYCYMFRRPSDPDRYKRYFLPILRFCIDQGAPDQIDLAMTVITEVWGLDEILPTSSTWGFPVFYSSIDASSGSEDSKRRCARIDFTCMIRSVKRLVLADEATEDVLQLTDIRVSPPGTVKHLAISAHEESLLADCVIRMMRVRPDLPLPSFLGPCSRAPDKNNIFRQLLADHADEFSEIEKEEISRHWPPGSPFGDQEEETTNSLL